MPAKLKEEIVRLGKTFGDDIPTRTMSTILMARGYRTHLNNANVLARAYAIKNLFSRHKPYIYENDLIAGSLYGQVVGDEDVKDEWESANALCESFGRRDFPTNADHFAADYDALVKKGIGGLLNDVAQSRIHHAQDEEALTFLEAMEISLTGFSGMVLLYANEAERTGHTDIAAACRAVAIHAPVSFREALQLVFLCHCAFVYEGRGAMALGRMDQYLYPFYQRDLALGILDDKKAQRLLSYCFIKLSESRWFGGEDVINIAIGGLTRDGKDATNSLSYAILRAVGVCNIPGPNLSARIHSGTPDDFLDECLQVIGTGLGYPALMNDEVNIPALYRYGYDLEDCRDYCMVGCIENFLPGRQPPWSDGRFNTPKFLELALYGGRDMKTGEIPYIETPLDFDSMNGLLSAFETQLRYGVSEYVAMMRNRSARLNPKYFMSPFLSCFCQDCIIRARDINDGGARYPSAHGACLMGIGTTADSLCALNLALFEQKLCGIETLRQALKADFAGHEQLHKQLLAYPKYGNNDDRVDQYAVFFLELLARLFCGCHTPDGGAVYLAMAANTQNISAGRHVAATPDGRRAYTALSDAASPMHGCDTQGPTAVVLSTTKPDYTYVACGTVLNQKFSPAMFQDSDKRAKLAALLRVYFSRGGQQMQINAISRQMLLDAKEHPGQYANLVVRVSGFSAYYVTLEPCVQEDILARTEQM